MDRAGHLQGKWLCGLNDLRRAGDCVILSVAVSEASFEAAVIQETQCRLFVLDPSLSSLPPVLESLASSPSPRVLWDKVGLAKSSGGVQIVGPSFPLVDTLEVAMQRHRIQFIDVLKVDFRGPELAALAATLRHSEAPLFGQLLLHVPVEPTGSRLLEEEVFELIGLLQGAGYTMYSKEVNLQNTTAIEFSFLHTEAWSKRHGASPNLRGRALPSPQVEERVPGAGVYFLSHGRRFEQLLLALQQLHRNCNWRYGYPVFLFLEDMPIEHQERLKAVSQGSYAIEVIDVKAEFSKPLPPEANGAPKTCRCSSHSSTIGYRRMCEFHAAGAARLLMEGKGFEWLWRLDDDSRLPTALGYDPFRLMVQNGQRYGTVVAMADDSACVEGLWQLAEAVAAELDSEGLLPHGLQFFDEWLPGLAQYNNFEISHVSVWRHPAYKRLWRAIEASGGVWQLRWGDAPIRTLGMLLTLAPWEVRFFQDVAYGHGPFINQNASALEAPRKVSSQSNCSNFSSSNQSRKTNNANSTCQNSSGAGMVRYSRSRAHGVLSTVPTLRYPPAPISEALPIPKENLSAKAMANAVVYSLVFDIAKDELQRMVESFGRNFLSSFPYPMILFVDSEDATSFATAVDSVRSAAAQLAMPKASVQQFPARILVYEDGAQAISGEEFDAILPFPLRIWRIPKLLTAPAWLQSVASSGDMRTICSNVAPEAHRALVRRLPDLLAHELSFDWLWKVSRTGELVEAVTEDPFLALEQAGKRLGHIGTLPQKEECLGGRLWETALEEARRFSGGAGEMPIPGSVPPTQLEHWPVGKVFISDSIISHASLWAAPAARRLLGRLDRSGGLWRSGWDEATLTTLVALVASEEPEFLQLHALPFRSKFVHWQRPKLANLLKAPQALPKLLVVNDSNALSAFQEWFPEAIKPQAEGWIGGDIATSVELPPHGNMAATRLWLFGDSFVGTATADGANRTSLQRMVHHAVARSRPAGVRGSSVRTAFEWGVPSIFDCTGIEEGKPVVLQEGEECVLWPSAAIAIEMRGSRNKLAIVAQRVARSKSSDTANTLTFRSLGSVAIIVENPEEPSNVWAWRAKVLDASNWWTNGLAAATGAAWAMEGDMIYVAGRQEVKQDGVRGWGDSGRAVLGRIMASELLALRLGSFQVLQSSGASGDTWAALGSSPMTLFSPAPAESSLLYHAGLWMSPSVENTRGGGFLTLRVARRPEGPWSDAEAVVALPREVLGLSCYSAKAHASESMPLVLSVVCVKPESRLGELATSQSHVYSPLFFPLRLSPMSAEEKQ